MTRSGKPALGIIGCGAVVEYWHLPALRSIGWRPSVLVDRNPAQARRLARKFNVPEVATRLDDAGLSMLDAALVATPHSVRSAVCVPLLEHGINVLLEKPVAISAEEGRKIEAAAERSNATISVGYVHRNSPIREWTTAVLRQEMLGQVRSFDVREGTKFGWDIKSNALWNKAESGGGVLMDQGTHTLDLVGHWFGDVSHVAYKDDSYGGVEAEAMIELKMQSGAEGVVELSRTRELTNRAVIEGTNGRLVVVINGFNRVIEAPARLMEFEHGGYRPDTMPKSIDVMGMFARQLEIWLRSLQDGGRPPIPASDSIRSVETIEKCYAVRTQWELPWVKPSRKRVLDGADA